MKARSILVLLVGLATFTACDEILQDSIEGKGPLVKKQIKVGSFDEVEISSAMKLFVRQGEKASVVVKSHKNVLNELNTKVRSGRLEFGMKQGSFRNMDLSIYITVPTIKYIGASGASEIEFYHFDHLKNLELDFSGASDFEALGPVTPVDRFVIDISGASDISALNIKAKTANVDLSGASSCELFATDFLNLDLSGASDVRYKGQPKIRQEVSGASSVETMK